MRTPEYAADLLTRALDALARTDDGLGLALVRVQTVRAEADSRDEMERLDDAETRIEAARAELLTVYRTLSQMLRELEGVVQR